MPSGSYLAFPAARCPPVPAAADHVICAHGDCGDRDNQPESYPENDSVHPGALASTGSIALYGPMDIETAAVIASIAIPLAALAASLWIGRNDPPQSLSPEEENYRWSATR
jgi:hypothetical protein